MVIQLEIEQQQTKGEPVMNKLAATSEPTDSKRKSIPDAIEDKVMREWYEAQNTSNTSILETEVDWAINERHVSRLQRQLANAVEHGNRKAIRHYKWLIRNSQHVKMLAIRSVMQENDGRKTPGIDGKTALTPKERTVVLG